MNQRQKATTPVSNTGSGRLHPTFAPYSVTYTLMLSPYSSSKSRQYEQARNTVTIAEEAGPSRLDHVNTRCEGAHISAAMQHKDSLSQAEGKRQARRAVQKTSLDLSGDGYLRLTEVLSVYPVSRAAWYEGMSDGI